MCCTERTPKSSSGRIMSARQVRHNTRQKKKKQNRRKKRASKIEDRGPVANVVCKSVLIILKLRPARAVGRGFNFARRISYDQSLSILPVAFWYFLWAVLAGWLVVTGFTLVCTYDEMWPVIHCVRMNWKGRERCNFGVLRRKFDYSVQVAFISNL